MNLGVNPGAWITGGDGFCGMTLQTQTFSIAAGTQLKDEICGGAATEPVTIYDEPHLVCVVCKPKVLELPGGAEMDMGTYGLHAEPLD